MLTIKSASTRGWLASCCAVFALAVSACSKIEVSPPQHGDLLITNVRLIGFSGDAPQITDNATVLIVNGKIADISANASNWTADETINASGRTLIPGLTDMHVHVWDETELNAYLGYGVTTVRNMSGMPFHLELQERIATGALTAPNLVTTGPILNSSGANAQINHQIVEDEDGARAAVHSQHAQGFKHLKVYSNLVPEAYQAIQTEAHNLGMTITGHTPEGRRTSDIPLRKPFEISFEDVLDDGFTTIEHTESIVWHGLRNSHDEDKARDLARKIKTANIPVTPTLLAHHNLLRTAKGGSAFLEREGVELLNPFLAGFEAENFAYWTAQPVPPHQKNDDFYARTTKILHEEGVMLVAGSDAGIFTNIPGLSLITELELLVNAGLSPYEAIKSATHNAAIVLKDAASGCVEIGCRADLVMYACDPLADISCMRSPHAIVRNGQALEPDMLLKHATMHDVERTQTNVFNGLAAQGTNIE